MGKLMSIKMIMHPIGLQTLFYFVPEVHFEHKK